MFSDNRSWRCKAPKQSKDNGRKKKTSTREVGSHFRISMSHRYTPVAHDDEEENSLKSPSGPHSRDTISISRRIFGLLVILTILNMMVAITHGYYSLRITKLLQEYEEKPLSSLPRIDPFNGQYRKPPLAGN